MSMLYRDASGNEKPVAGLNGLSGELVYGASTVRSGTCTFVIPANQEVGTGNTTDEIPFSDPMPDADYNVILSCVSQGKFGDYKYDVHEGSKTKTGFKINYARINDSLISRDNTIVIHYTAFKLFTVEGLEDLENAVSDVQNDISDLQEVTTAQVDLGAYAYNGRKLLVFKNGKTVRVKFQGLANLAKFGAVNIGTMPEAFRPKANPVMFDIMSPPSSDGNNPLAICRVTIAINGTISVYMYSSSDSVNQANFTCDYTYLIA